MSEANSGMTLHSLVSDVTVSHAIVILLNNPLSRAILTFLIPLIASVYKPTSSNAYSVQVQLCAAMYPDIY